MNDTVQRLARHGQALYLAGDDRGALDLFDQLLSVDPRSAMAHFRRGLCLKQLGALSEAHESLTAAVHIEPSHWAFWYELGQVCSHLGRAADAERATRRAAQAESGHSEVHYFLGTLLSDRGAEEAAIVEWQRAVAADPSNHLAHDNLGVYFLNGAGRDPERALAHFAEVVRVVPSDRQGVAKVVQCLYRLGRGAETAALRAKLASLVHQAFDQGELPIPEFCIDQFFSLSGHHVFVVEYAIRRPPGSPFEVWYGFKVLRSERLEQIIQLEVSDYARETAAPPFLLGSRYPNGSHATFSIAWQTEPDYGELKSAVLAVLAPDAPQPIAVSGPA